MSKTHWLNYYLYEPILKGKYVLYFKQSKGRKVVQLEKQTTGCNCLISLKLYNTDLCDAKPKDIVWISKHGHKAQNTIRYGYTWM